jgi:hypothetical protein
MVSLEKIRLRSNEKVFTVEGHESRLSRVLLKPEGQQDMRIKSLRINGEDVPLGQTKVEQGKILILFEGDEITLSTLPLRAKVRNDTSYVSLWVDRKIPANIQERVVQ